MSNGITVDAGVASGEQSDPFRRRKLGFLGWAVGIIVIAGMGIAVLLPSLCKAREPANRAKCSSNLHQIGLAISLYADDNAGHYPPSLATLLRDEQLTGAVMICPSSNDEAATAPDTAHLVADVDAAEKNTPGCSHCLSYIYVGSQLTETSASPTAVVAYEPLENHAGDGTNVLFGDGHAEWVTRAAWPGVAASAGISVTPAKR